MVDEKYEAQDASDPWMHDPWRDKDYSFEECDALSLQFTPYQIMRDIVGRKAELLFWESGRGCCGIDSQCAHPSLRNFMFVGKGNTPSECCSDWCSKYWREVKWKILSVVEREGIGELDIEAVFSAEQFALDPSWFRWNDIEGTVASGIQVLRRRKELVSQLAAVIETTTNKGVELF